MDCLKCTNNCCENSIISINVLDLAKIIYTFNPEININEKGFGIIKEDNKTIIRIKTEYSMGKQVPRTELENPCPYLTGKKCRLHYLELIRGIILSDTLEGLGQSLRVKPKICVDHPEYYDFRLGQTMMFAPCYSLKNIVVANDNKIIQSSIVIGELQTALYDYYQLTKEYLIVDLAKEVVNNKYAINNFIHKLNNEKNNKKISEERISNHYPALNNLLNNIK